jgi:hypothetical protein
MDIPIARPMFLTDGMIEIAVPKAVTLHATLGAGLAF